MVTIPNVQMDTEISLKPAAQYVTVYLLLNRAFHHRFFCLKQASLQTACLFLSFYFTAKSAPLPRTGVSPRRFIQQKLPFAILFLSFGGIGLQRFPFGQWESDFVSPSLPSKKKIAFGRYLRVVESGPEEEELEKKDLSQALQRAESSYRIRTASKRNKS